MKKKIMKFLSLVLVVIMVAVGSVFYKNKSTIYINHVLKQEAYSYLPDEAKEYVKKVYEDTGEVVLTEKSKKENMPYLNPKYIEYLELDEEERKEFDLVPDTFILDYSTSQTYTNFDFPSSYDLRNQNGNNFVSPIKNQGTTSICWAFASIENVETLYMKNNNQPYSDITPNFSIRQMDYITSTNYDSSSSTSYLAIKGSWSSGMCTYSSGCSWTSWNNPDNGSHELDKGGNFYTSSIAMANGITLTDESIMPWHEKKQPVLVNDIYGYDKSLYEVNSTIQMPTINIDHASEELINSYVGAIKYYMLQYGGPFIGTYSPKSTCGFENVDGLKVLKTDDCVNNTNNKDLGHAMQIIGWDDEYEYTYCESGTNHKSVNNNGTCNSGELTTGKGAWILRNSWGTENAEAQEYSYVYLTYDSTRLSVGFTTSISDMQNRTWDNNYHSNPWIERNIINGMASVESQTKEFNTHNNNSEKIEKIKFLTSSFNGEYSISILTENKNYNNIEVITTDEVGIYTIDLSSKNIVLNDTSFSIKIEGKDDSQFINDSISVFTSNVNNELSIETEFISGIKTYEDPKDRPSEDNVAFVSSYGDITLKFKHYLKNVPDYKKITYKVLRNGVDYSNYFFKDYYLLSSNMVYIDGTVTSSVVASEETTTDIEVCGKVYTFQILYDNEVIESFPLKRICRNWDGETTDFTTSKINFHKNDGSGYFSTITENDTTILNIMKSDGTGNIYIPNKKEFFLYDRYIKSWNTKPDGTGVNYTDNDYLVYKDMDLYAQWSDPKTEEHKYNIKWNCSVNTCNEGAIKIVNATFNKEIIMPYNFFTNVTSGQEFIYWAFDQDSDQYYYEEEKVINLTKYGFESPYNNEEWEYLYPVWSDSYNTVVFDANNGSGTMKEIKMVKDKSSRLKYNLFEREGYSFTGWNTKADGTGISYADGENVSLTEDTTLYAQWGEKSLVISFNANGGTGTINQQQVSYNTSTKLSKNTFEKNGYTFKEWNTKADGTGTSYADEQMIALTDNMTLYAIWVKSFDYTINNYDVDETNKYISKIMVNTEINNFTSNFTLGYGYGIEVDYKEINDKKLLYTGGKTRITHGLDLYKEYTNIVIGDINGDGAINSADLLKIRQHLLGINILSGAYFLSSDINYDNTINSADLLRIRQHLLGVKPIE